jgi:hypothetical protein
VGEWKSVLRFPSVTAGGSLNADPPIIEKRILVCEPESEKSASLINVQPRKRKGAAELARLP